MTLPRFCWRVTAQCRARDGFIADLTHICEVGNVAAKVELDKIPFSYAARNLIEKGVVSVEDLLTGGDDYEIAMAIPPSSVDAFLADAKARGVDAHAIGVFEDAVEGNGGVHVLDASGSG